MSLTPKCSFRIIGLSSEELSDLERKYLIGIPFRTGIYHKDRSKKVLRLMLDESTNPELLQHLTEEKPDDAISDFFVSVSSEQESAVVDVPDYILDLHRRVGGGICFSYTCTFDPDE